MSEQKSSERVPLGHKMRNHFLLSKDWKNLNHGAYGTVPISVRETLRHFQDLAETCPDSFFRRDYRKHLLRSRQAVAELVHAPFETVVLVPNTTTGVNTVLRNLQYTPQDHILTFSTVYGACGKSVFSVCETTGAKLTSIPITHPASDATVVSDFRDAVRAIRESGHQPKIAIFDTITSMPGVRMPFESLTAACRDLGVLSCIDGAHGIGQIPLNLSKLDPDFFLTNTHKWLFVPRPCAVFYVPLKNQHLIRTSLPTSWGFVELGQEEGVDLVHDGLKQSRFELLFDYVGTLDISPYLCIPAALEFRKKVCGGEDEVMRHNSRLAATGGAKLARMLGTDVMENEEGTLTKDCAMVNVRLPLDPERLTSNFQEIFIWMQKMMMERYNTFAPVFMHAGKVWVRVSGQIYLKDEDFEFLGSVLVALCKDIVENEATCMKASVL